MRELHRALTGTARSLRSYWREQILGAGTLLEQCSDEVADPQHLPQVEEC